MKAAEFDYVRADSVEDVCRLLAGAADDAEHKIIAGGQTLVPLMAMRLARPTLLVDINGIDALAGIAVEGDALAIRAGTRQRAVERSDEAATALPLLAKALRHVGHQQTRNRGTVGGSLVHGDPSAEIPLVAVALDAALTARSLAGEHAYRATAFFEGPMVTALAPDQCLVEVRFPIWRGARIGTGFREISSREGDFAIVAACAQVQLDDGGRCARIALGAGGVAGKPVRLAGAEAALAGTTLDDEAVALALAGMDAEIEPDTDLHATADYRARVARVLVGRAIAEARAEAAR